MRRACVQCLIAAGILLILCFRLRPMMIFPLHSSVVDCLLLLLVFFLVVLEGRWDMLARLESVCCGETATDWRAIVF